MIKILRYKCLYKERSPFPWEKLSKETDHLATYDSSFETAAVAGEEMKSFTSGSLTFIEVRLATVRSYNHLIYVQTYDMNDFPSKNYCVKVLIHHQKKKIFLFFLTTVFSSQLRSSPSSGQGLIDSRP